jgi:DNA-binding NtrC family response regulator
MDYADRMHKPIKAISEEFMEALVCHSWPGNVRELQNFIERSVILSTGGMLTGSLPELTGTLKLSAPVTLEEAETSHILQTLQLNERSDRWFEWCGQPPRPAADHTDRQDEAAKYPSRAKLSVTGASSSVGPNFRRSNFSDPSTE